jgi:hypothetical protein
MTYPQHHDSARVSPFVSRGVCDRNEAARNSFWRADPGLNINAKKERQMSMTPDTPGICPAQYTDPLIVNARLVNLAAEIERNLAARRALRPARSDAAKRGWEVRRDR